jgi:hypothetical protein
MLLKHYQKHPKQLIIHVARIFFGYDIRVFL